MDGDGDGDANETNSSAGGREGERDTLRPPAADSPDQVTLALAPISAKLALIHDAIMQLTDEVSRLGERQRQESSELRQTLADHDRRISIIEQRMAPNGHDY